MLREIAKVDGDAQAPLLGAIHLLVLLAIGLNLGAALDEELAQDAQGISRPVLNYPSPFVSICFLFMVCRRRA